MAKSKNLRLKIPAKASDLAALVDRNAELNSQYCTLSDSHSIEKFEILKIPTMVLTFKFLYSVRFMFIGAWTVIVVLNEIVCFSNLFGTRLGIVRIPYTMFCLHGCQSVQS